jgi:protein KRI1
VASKLLKGKKIDYSEYEFGNGGDDDDEEDDIMMDADYLPGGEHYDEENEPSSDEDKPVDTTNMTSKDGEEDPLKFLDDYYRLDYEDMVSGVQ